MGAVLLKRRRFLAGSLALAGLGLISGCGLRPSGVPPARTVRIGLLSPYSIDPSPEGTALRQALRELGYIEGRNLTLVLRNGSGREALASRAADLAGLPVDVIIAVGDLPVRAAREASATIPIVMIESSDPVGNGFVASLGRPGGNVTGLTSVGTALGPKRLEFLVATAPGVKHVALMLISNSDEALSTSELQAAATAKGVRLSVLTSSFSMLDGRYAETVGEGVDGLVVLTDASGRATPRYPKRLVELAAEQRLPAMYDARDVAEAGGLMAYGPNRPGMFRRAAYFVDRILKGTQPADLPIEQPTMFDFVINLKTAKTLGLTIPEAVLAQATEVLQ